MIGGYKGREGKLSFLFLLVIFSIVFSGINGDNVNAQERVNVQFKFVNVDDDSEINNLEENYDVGENVDYIPPETISVDGSDYTIVEPIELNEVVTEDTEYVLEYTGQSITPKPENHIELGENSTEGMVDINDIIWRLQGNQISAEVDVEVSGKHMATRLGTISQTVGTDNELIEDESDALKTDTAMKKASNFSDDFSDSNTFDRDTDGVYRLKISYWYTNLAEGNFECGTGTEDRCFEWVLDEDEPYTPYWGSFSEEVEVGDELVRSTNIYELEVELDIDDVSNKDYTIAELPEQLPIGKGVSDTTNVVTGKVDDDSSLVDSFYERFDITNPEEFELQTNQSVNVEEYIGYENDFNEDLEVNGSPKYYIGNIDKNLEEQLDSSEYGYGVDLIYNPNNQSFELDKTFGLTNKYGIQFLTDRRDYLNNKVDLVDLNESKDEELGRLGLEDDSVVNLDYTKSRYFLPIDDEEYLNEEETKQYKDTVILDGIGLNNLSLRYDKLFTVNQPLFSEDSESYFKGFTQEIDDSEVKYKDSEILSEDTLQDYLKAYETSENIHLFRSTDDKELKEHISESDE